MVGEFPDKSRSCNTRWSINLGPVRSDCCLIVLVKESHKPVHIQGMEKTNGVSGDGRS